MSKPNTKKSAKKAFLIDGNSFCYRAHYAIRALSNSKGRPTNAIYGFVMMLNKIIKEENPDYLAVAFDSKAKTFRHNKYEEYKATREAMPDELSAQIPIIKDILQAYKVPVFELAGYEGEDIIAAVIDKINNKNINFYIATGDKDIMQLVNNEVYVYNTNKDGEIYNDEKVEKKFGVKPDKIIDLMALTGDKSDNIPGVSGIGPKTALKLIKEFSSLENIIKHAGEIKNERISKLISEHKDEALLSKELVTIDKKAPLQVDIKALELKEADNKKLFEIYKELEFRNLLKDFAPDNKSKADYRIIQGDKEFKSLIKELKNNKIFSFDFETDSPNPHEAIPVGMSFSFKEAEAFYLPIRKGKYLAKEGFELKKALSLLKDVIEDENIRKVGQNIKYEYIILKRFGLKMQGVYFDTMIASYLLNPSKSNHNLDDISLEYIGYKMTSYKQLVKGDKKKEIPITEVNIKELSDYACEDADITYRLYKVLEKKLKENDLWKLYIDVEIPLVEVLGYMEANGISLDEKKLKKLSREISKSIDQLRNKITKIAGVEFNLNSPKQLREILFSNLKLPVIKKTKTGPSTDVEVLSKLSKDHKLPALLLQYRELAKIKSTYTESLCGLINCDSGKIHTSFNQTVTQTGRLSSSNPNLQNIPMRGEYSQKIREAFVCSNNKYIFLSADYSQIELRILAHLSKDKALRKAFKDGLDVHAYTASLVYDTNIKDVTAEMRSVAKTVNFSVIYGVSAYGLSRELEMDISEAKEFIDNYFKRYPQVKKYIDETIEKAEKNGYVVSLFGRRRYIPQLKSNNMQQVNFGKRVAINMPIQATASDIIKIAMVNIYKKFIKNQFKSKMILQIHDELIFEVYNDELSKIKDIVRREMEDVVKLDIPITVDVKTGHNWAQC
jgi:DNA polymerase-1